MIGLGMGGLILYGACNGGPGIVRNVQNPAQTRNTVKTFGGKSTNSERKVRSKKKPSYLRKHGYNIFDNYFMTAMK